MLYFFEYLSYFSHWSNFLSLSRYNVIPEGGAHFQPQIEEPVAPLIGQSKQG